MGVRTGWYDEEHNVLLTEFIGTWTWEEMWETYRAARKLASTVDYKIATIIDVTHSNPYPPPGALWQMKRVADLKHPNTGLTVYVNASRFMKIITRLFWIYFRESADKYPFEFANSVAEADAIITRHRDEWA